MMDLTQYKQILKETMDEVAFGNPESVASKAEAKVKEFLETNTSIPDDKKAEIYASFLQQIVLTTINQAIQAGVQLPVNEKQIEVMERETVVKEAQSAKDLEVKQAQIDTMSGELAIKQAMKDSDIAVNNQKIASMQAEDEARKNEVAAKIARVKYEIEQLLPSEVAINRKELEIKEKQVDEVQKRVELFGQQIEVEKAKVPLMQFQAKTEAKRVDMMAAQVEIEKAKIPLTQAQVEVEKAKIPLIQAQAQSEAKRVDILKEQVENEKAKRPLIEAQVQTEKAKALLTEEEAGYTKAKSDTAYWEAIVASKKADTLARTLDVNKDIEKCKCETNLKIAQLQAERL